MICLQKWSTHKWTATVLPPHPNFFVQQLIQINEWCSISILNQAASLIIVTALFIQYWRLSVMDAARFMAGSLFTRYVLFLSLIFLCIYSLVAPNSNITLVLCSSFNTVAQKECNSNRMIQASWKIKWAKVTLSWLHRCALRIWWDFEKMKWNELNHLIQPAFVGKSASDCSASNYLKTLPSSGYHL